MNSVIAERTKGQFPISIATSLAYESLMNIHEFTKHNRIPVFDYRVMWVNVATLLRNIIGSCSDRDRALSDVEGLVEAIIEEMEFIRSFSYNEAKGLTTKFYYSLYKDFDHTYKHAYLKHIERENQRKLTDIQKMVLGIHKLVLKRVAERVNDPALPIHKQTIMVFNNKLGLKEIEKTIILTHNAYDLLSHYNFRYLDLLESHTGAIKKRTDWYTKLKDGKLHPNIPFSEPMIQIFGDENQFGPADKKIRAAILAVAEKKHWHQLTTLEKMKSDLKQNILPPNEVDWQPFFEEKIPL